MLPLLQKTNNTNKYPLDFTQSPNSSGKAAAEQWSETINRN